MTKSKIFLILSLSFILGIFSRSFWDINLLAIYLLFLAAVISAIVFYKNKIILLSGCAALFFVFGIRLTDNRLEEIKNTAGNSQNYSGEALIVKEPAISGYYQKITAEINFGHPMSKILINAGKYPEYFYGDKIKLDCDLQVPENFEEGFDYRMYLAKDGILYVCKSAKVELIARDQGSKFYAGILKIKNKFNDNINHLIPFPESILLSGLILGGSSGLPAELKDNFSRTGMTHIVAVSGYNITIIAGVLMWFFIFIGLWRQKAFWAAIMGIFLFILMIGFPSSAVRAGVMGTLLLWAMKNGRLANAQNAVVFAAVVMLFFNPLLLRWDIGFQLSFLATLGIIYLYPFFETKFDNNSKLAWAYEILFLSLSAQIFVLPIILHNFQTLSLISLLANVLILPIVPLTMLLGFLPAAAQFLFPPLAQVLAWLAFLPLKYEVAVVSFLGNLKYAAVEIRIFPWWGVVIWYIILLTFLRQQRKVTKENNA